MKNHWSIKILFLLFPFTIQSVVSQPTSDFELFYKMQINTIDPILALPYHKVLETKLKNLTISNKSATEEAIAKHFHYTSFFQEELKKHGLPSVFQYFPLALTQMNQRFQTQDHRAGIWALPNLVALRYHLEVNNEIDERMDIYKSTVAACRYLSDLFQLYGDPWEVIIAYSEGATCLNTNKIRLHTVNTNPWELYENGKLNNKEFIPNLLIYAYLSNYYNKYNLQIKKYNPPQSIPVFLQSTIYLSDLYNTLTISEEDFYLINPTLLYTDTLPAIAVNIPNHIHDFNAIEEVLYEKYKAEQMRLDSIIKEQELKKEAEPQNIVYTVKKGDCLSAIARKYHVSVYELKKWNHLKSDKIDIGQKLIIFKD
mgnify:CR=1 FL=1